MQIKLFSEMINKELSFILPRSLILDTIIYIVTFPLYKLSSEIPLGLFLGTFIMLLNFVILGMSAERAVERPMGAAKRLMLGSYFLRFLIMAVLFIGCIKVSSINLLSAAIPQFYPKVFYSLQASLKNKKGG